MRRTYLLLGLAAVSTLTLGYRDPTAMPSLSMNDAVVATSGQATTLSFTDARAAFVRRGLRIRGEGSVSTSKDRLAGLCP